MADQKFLPGSCLVFDALERLGVTPRLLNLDIKPLNKTDKIFGPLFTLKGISGVTDEQKKNSRFFFEEITAGEIVAVEVAGGYGIGHWGELMSHGAMTKGAQGVIVPGGCRDSLEVRELGFPVFCEYTSPFESGSEYCIGEWQVPIALPGLRNSQVACSPGEYVVADADGIIIFEAALLEDVTRMTGEINRKEKLAIMDMKNGGQINDAFVRNGVV
jgi:4-hydroxy-4-methyl-2-oxoglutarate aldolase